MANQFTTNLFSIVPIGNHQRIGTLTTAQNITIPANATGLLIQAEDQNVVFVFGAASTISTDSGFLLKTTDQPARLDLFPGAVIRVLESAVGGAVNYQFFRSV